MTKSNRAEGGLAAIAVVIILVITAAAAYSYGASGIKTVTKTSTTTQTAVSTQTATLTEYSVLPKTNLTASFILYGSGAAIGYHFYDDNNSLLTSGTLNSNQTVLVFSHTIGKVTLTTQMPNCGACSAKIALSDNGTTIAVGYNTSGSINNMTGVA